MLGNGSIIILYICKKLSTQYILAVLPSDWGRPVPGDVGPGAMMHRERLKVTGGGLVRRLVSAAGGTGVHKLLGVIL